MTKNLLKYDKKGGLAEHGVGEKLKSWKS